VPNLVGRLPSEQQIFGKWTVACYSFSKPFDPVKPKPISSIPSHFSQAKTDLLHPKPLQLSQNRLLSFQAIPVRPKPNSTIPSHSSFAKTDFLRSKPFQSGQN
jgi:hypothetical protein